MDQLPEQVGLRSRRSAPPIARWWPRRAASTSAASRRPRPRRSRRRGDAPRCWSRSPPSGGGRINQHFGHATEFQVYEVSPDGIALRRPSQGRAVLRGRLRRGRDARRRDRRAGGRGRVLCAKIGDCPQRQLADAGIEATARPCLRLDRGRHRRLVRARYRRRGALTPDRLNDSTPTTERLTWPTRSSSPSAPPAAPASSSARTPRSPRSAAPT